MDDDDDYGSPKDVFPIKWISWNVPRQRKPPRRERPTFDTAKFMATETGATCKTVAGLKSMVEKEFEV